MTGNEALREDAADLLTNVVDDLFHHFAKTEHFLEVETTCRRYGIDFQPSIRKDAA